MRQHQDALLQDDAPPADTTGNTGGDLIRSDDIHIRNYDRRWAYDLDIEAVRSGGIRLFEKHYYLQPGQTEREAYVLPSGEYTVTATLDNSDTVTTTCRVDSAPENTVVIEVGNGALSLTQRPTNR